MTRWRWFVSTTQRIWFVWNSESVRTIVSVWLSQLVWQMLYSTEQWRHSATTFWFWIWWPPFRWEVVVWVLVSSQHRIWSWSSQCSVWLCHWTPAGWLGRDQTNEMTLCWMVCESWDLDVERRVRSWSVTLEDRRDKESRSWSSVSWSSNDWRVRR